VDYLTYYRPPRAILWFVPAIRFHDSMATSHIPFLQRQVQELWPNTVNHSYTTSMDTELLNATVVKGGGDAMHFLARQLFLEWAADFSSYVSIARANNVDYEIVVSTHLWLLMMVAEVLCPIKFQQYAMFVYVPPLAPEKGNTYSGTSYDLEVDALRKMRDRYVCAFVLDNEYERRKMEQLYRAAGWDHFNVRTARTYVWQDRDVDYSKKRNLVVWGGRTSAQKNIPLLYKVFALLNHEKAVSFTLQKTAWNEKFMNIGAQVIVNAGRAEYYELLSKAKVSVITSTTEGLPRGWCEMVEFGVVPVIWRRPWAFDIFGEDYPLYWDKPTEVPELVEYVFEHYDELLPMVQSRVKERYQPNKPFSKEFEEEWAKFLTSATTKSFDVPNVELRSVEP